MPSEYLQGFFYAKKNFFLIRVLTLTKKVLILSCSKTNKKPKKQKIRT